MSSQEPLFPDELLAAVRRGGSTPERAAEARFFGRNYSKATGESPEFRDLRPYRPGDDLRRADWNVYRRFGKLFIRRFCNLPEKRRLLILDNSESMRCHMVYIRTAWRIAALLGGAWLNSGDPVFLRVGNFGLEFAPGCSGTAEFVAALTRCFDSPPALPRFDHGEKCDCFVISDFLHPEGMAAAERAILNVPGFTPVRIREADEDAPHIDGEVRLVDAESGETTIIRPDREILRRYHDNLRYLKELLDRAAARAGSRAHTFDAGIETPELIRRTAEEFSIGSAK